MYQRVPNRQVPIFPLRHACCRTYRLATKLTGKASQRKTRDFWSRERANMLHVTFQFRESKCVCNGQWLDTSCTRL